jgi:HEPN domain-containing protein/predicted nucleotidyltransferase
MAQPLVIPEHAQEIAARIVAAIRPWRIVLFGSRARGNARENSDYDVYVEIDDAQASLDEIATRLRRLAYPDGPSIDFKVKHRGEIERRRDDPGTIEWDVAREGRVLYADPSASTTLMSPWRVSESSPDVPESVHEWLETAERDMRHCRRLEELDEGYWPEICGLSQQMSEKYLKALLISRRVRPERTHDLEKLLGALRGAGCDLSGLDTDCALLTTHAVIPRYPAGLNLGPEDASRAFAAAERVVAAVRALLPPSVH